MAALYRRPVEDKTRRRLTVAYWLLMLGGRGSSKANRVGVRFTDATVDRRSTELFGFWRFFCNEDRGAATGFWSGLEKVQHFSEIVLELFIVLNEIASPFRRIPNLQPVIHPNQDNL